jgi:UDP-glucose 4-epimerase
MKSDCRSVFITGGLGYVGARLATYMAKQGFRVKIGSQRALSLADSPWMNEVEIVPYSTGFEVSKLEDILRDVDTIYHLASPNEIICATMPEKALIENSVGTLRLCQAAKNLSIRRFIFLSTAHVYRAPLEGEFSESNACFPTHPYAYSHLAAENVVHSFAGPNGIDRCIVVRLTNSVGYPARADTNRWTLIANDLCRQAVINGQLVIRSNPMARRDFISMYDVTRALLHLGLLPMQNHFDIFNLGSGRSMTLLELGHAIADEASALLNRPIAVQHQALGENQHFHLAINVDKLKNTGFTWLHDLKEELSETISFCKEYISCTRVRSSEVRN